MTCKKCGKDIVSDSIYCSYCKTKVKNTSDKNSQPKFKTVYFCIMNGLYLIAIITCFICNLAINHSLTWFYIVIVSVSISWSITNFPFLLKRGKLIIPAITVSTLIYLLLYVCCVYVNGSWLLSIAYPMVTVSLLYIWALLVIIAFVRTNRMIKAAIILLISALSSATINSTAKYLVDGVPFNISEYFSLSYWPLDIIGNKVSFWGLLGCGFITLTIGIIKIVKSRTK